MGPAIKFLEELHELCKRHGFVITVDYVKNAVLSLVAYTEDDWKAFMADLYEDTPEDDAADLKAAEEAQKEGGFIPGDDVRGTRPGFEVGRKITLAEDDPHGTLPEDSDGGHA